MVADHGQSYGCFKPTLFNSIHAEFIVLFGRHAGFSIVVYSFGKWANISINKEADMHKDGYTTTQESRKTPQHQYLKNHPGVLSNPLPKAYLDIKCCCIELTIR